MTEQHKEDVMIETLAREYVRTRRAHANAMREGLLLAVAGEGSPPPPDLGREVLAEDGVPLTVGGEEPDGVFRWRERAFSSIAYDRAERRLRAALESGANGPVAAAARAVFDDQREPFYSYQVDDLGQPINPDEKRRVDERIARYVAVFKALEREVEEQK